MLNVSITRTSGRSQRAGSEFQDAPFYNRFEEQGHEKDTRLVVCFMRSHYDLRNIACSRPRRKIEIIN